MPPLACWPTTCLCKLRDPCMKTLSKRHAILPMLSSKTLGPGSPPPNPGRTLPLAPPARNLECTDGSVLTIPSSRSKTLQGTLAVTSAPRPTSLLLPSRPACMRLSPLASRPCELPSHHRKRHALCAKQCYRKPSMGLNHHRLAKLHLPDYDTQLQTPSVLTPSSLPPQWCLL